MISNLAADLMEGGGKHIWYLTVRFPMGAGEEFLEAEIECLRGLGKLTVVPIFPKRGGRSCYSHVLAPSIASPATWVVIGRSMLRRPIAVLRATLRPLRRSPWRSRIRTLAALPKAVWLAGSLQAGAHVHAAWASTPATVAMVAAEIAGVPWSFSAHRHDIDVKSGLESKIASAQFVRAISDRARSDVIDLGGPLADERTVVIHLGVHVPALRLSQEHRLDRVGVLVPGALIKLKNHETLIRAVAADASNRFELTFAGAGPEMDRLISLAAELDVADRVRLLGYVPHPELLDAYCSPAVRIVSLASLIEGIPVVLMEALARGKPVVASDVGGVAELVTEDVGLLVRDPLNPLEYLRAWEQVALWNPNSVAQRAWARIDREFNARRTSLKLFEAIY